MKYKCVCDHHKLCASFLRFFGPSIALGKIYQGQNVLMPDMSQGWTCLRCLKLLLYKKAEKERLRRSENILGPDLSQGCTCLGAGIVSGLGLSQGCTCLRAWLVSGLDLSRDRTCPKTSGPDLSKSFRKCLATGNVQKFRAGSVLWPDLVRGQTSLGALVWTWLSSIDRQNELQKCSKWKFLIWNP